MNSSNLVRTFRWGAALAPILLLAACATVFEGGYQRAEGWRRGGVVSVQEGATLERPGYWNCTRDLSLEQRASKRYVLVWYVEGRYKGYYAAEASPSREYVKNEPVYVNVSRCHADAVVARNDRGDLRP